MEKISLEEYKDYLVNTYMHECDNNEFGRNKRRVLLANCYTDTYLESVISGTYNLVNKIFDLSEDNYPGFIEIPLDYEPDIHYLSLNLTGGWMSDTIVRDSDNNFYSLGILRKVFGPMFIIEPSKVEFYEEIDEDDDFSIVSEIPSWSFYFQCSKEAIDSAKGNKVLKLTK